MDSSHRGIHSSHRAPYVDPEHPGVGDSVQVRLRASAKARIDRVVARVILNGIDQYVEARPQRTGSSFAWFSAEFTLTQPSTHYHFIIHESNGDVLYYTRRGISSVYPDESGDLVIDSELHVPEWVSSARFYQIFPDRFFRGDPSLGVRDGERTRDGFVSREMAWTDEPLPYAEGGSLDFFNGDLPGIEAKLDYLKLIGFNALYLTPTFRAVTNHRYDCIDYFSVDPALGGDDALASLVRAAHEADMRVMIDVSINHIGIEHAWMNGLDGEEAVIRQSDGTHVRWAGVRELAKLDFTSASVRAAVYEREDSVVQRYLRPPFSIDGWRFDVASEVARFGEAQLGPTVWSEIRHAIRSQNPDAYIVGEHWHDSTEFLGSRGWDSAMNYYASGRVARLWLGERDRYATPSGAEVVPGREITGAEVATLVTQHFARIPSGTVDAQFNILDSHDVPRLHNHDAVFSWDTYAGAIAFLYMLPGTFSAYYGDEVGLAGNADGDHGKRYPMEWREFNWDKRFLELYSGLVRLKQSRVEWQTGSDAFLATEDEWLAYARWNADAVSLLFLNRAKRSARVEVDLSLLGDVSVTDAWIPGSTRTASWELEGSTLRADLPARQSLLLTGLLAAD